MIAQHLTFDDYLHSPRWTNIIVATASEFDDFVFTIPKDPTRVVRIIRGHRCRSKASLLGEFAAALQFPQYFGANWDAFEECLTDLEWLHSDGLILCIAESADVLVEHPNDLKTLAAILCSAHDGPLRSIFLQCTPDEEAVTRERYSRAGWPL